METRTNVWDGVGSKEQFLCHTVAIWEALQGIGLLKKHEEAEGKVLEVREELKQARESCELTKQHVEVCESETEKCHFVRSWPLSKHKLRHAKQPWPELIQPKLPQ